MKIRRIAFVAAFAALPLFGLAAAPNAGALPAAGVASVPAAATQDTPWISDAAAAEIWAEEPGYAVGARQAADPCFHEDALCRLGPTTLPKEGPVAELILGYQRLHGLSPERFLETYWDPNAQQDWGNWRYPDKLGFYVADDGTVMRHKVELNKGTVLDRFGPETGSFLSPSGTPFTERSMPPSALNTPVEYTQYKVLKPFPVHQGLVAPYFNQVGLGTQQLLDNRLVSGAPSDRKKFLPWLVKNEYLQRLKTS
ncbi:TNT domain-containing protein [Streptomyces spiramyceticus]|uniref:TNT domain-containing protein n=1 Tax=Streptomyces spiramyceticus TaxID=299717 RepID=UPI00237C35A9|nr:TNT domain-containing protein [Streptomyces spiramyceticus]